jgi:hypothetical protein
MIRLGDGRERSILHVCAVWEIGVLVVTTQRKGAIPNHISAFLIVPVLDIL